MAKAAREMPAIYTNRDTRGNLTGSWRYMRPELTHKGAPCAAACPAGNPIAEFMSLAAAGDSRAALSAIKKENPLPSICGRVCPHPCTSSCNRAGFDAALAINEIERSIGDSADKHGLCIPEAAARSGKSVAVIGSGPAGLSFAYHSALSGHSVTIFEAGSAAGGLLCSGIPAYRLPSSALARDLGFIGQLGISLKLNTKIDIGGNAALTKDFDAVCISIGAHKPTRLWIPGEDLDGVIPGLEFLAAARSAAPVIPGKNTIVIGGGNTALDAARTALRLGARATIVYRRERNEMPAFDDEIVEASEEGVNFIFLASPIRLTGRSGKTSAVTFQKMRLGDMDDTGRRRPVPVEGETFEVEADCVITAVGESPEEDYGKVFSSRRKNLAPAISGWGETPDEKIFVCGDAGPNTRTVAHAIGSGKRAAIAADARFNKKDLDKIKKEITVCGGTVSAAAYITGISAPDSAVSPSDLNTAYFSVRQPLGKQCIPVQSRIGNFDEINTTAGEEEINTEALRCFSCGRCTLCGNCLMYCPEMSVSEEAGGGAPGFNLDYCKGCGICARECPRGIIGMSEEGK